MTEDGDWLVIILNNTITHVMFSVWFRFSFENINGAHKKERRLITNVDGRYNACRDL